ncbi:MAG: TetR/AcrR family transcriptional regulator [Candidatus Thiodiazotropha sp. (ex Lucinoma borealis)]|nr:TetR/AcrR family transcriptional regulator [Candidatus Thiodiazotropha sp. (ex Lucinoma borealis)]MCU7854312.1 TetR/AcrR family transcriptional regulator [Candidatus Thiodiazotropha sp. (ex Lucinoma borealis)]MCU7862465.1 TetR/AcrR family transcriptional regulator [Candidatus Thiodiazotropha sp. (ex Lucinoma borealis)]MCU7867117.1 TetR/AcrR family transcriptional regulator [Candidatus Thiodiazotropha sp. (ex Lucinoma borealis)]
MPRDGTITRNKIMDVAQQMVLDVGLTGTSVEKVIGGAGVTKGTFFYHFKTKHDLAASLIERYADDDQHHFHDFMTKAEQLARDPLQQLLIFLGLFIEMTEKLEDPFPGCLYAAYCYQSGAISPEVMNQVKQMMHFWREKLSEKLAAVNALYPSRIPVTHTQVADHVLTTFEGAYILSKVMKEPKLASEQIIQCRNYIELLFSPETDQNSTEFRGSVV